MVGGGPRGIAVVERILANAPTLHPEQLDVLLIEPYRPGGGRVWDPDQPSHLLMNTLCADATHFTDETVEIVGPIRRGPSLYDWAHRIVDGTVTNLGTPSRPLDDEHHREAEQMHPHSHPSRRFLGGYLEWCHAQDLSDAADHIRVQHIRGTAIRVFPDEDRWRITVAETVMPTDPGYDHNAPRHDVLADAVVLATGHGDREPFGRSAEIVADAEREGLWYGAPTSPISQHDLAALRPDEPVIVRGLGMNFFDYLSLLTLGRGGEFVEGGDTEDPLRYVASGREPRIVVGSGRGVPYRAKGRFGGMTPVFPKHYLTPEVIDGLAARIARGERIDFRRDLFPFIMKDAARVYYEKLAEQYPESLACDAQEIITALSTCEWGSPQLDVVIERCVPDPADRLQVTSLDRPMERREFESTDAFRQWWLSVLRRDLHEADCGMASALKCASVQIGAGRNPLRRLVRYGGVRGGSFRDDVDGWFRGFAGALASGPPARRIEELIALVTAGIVQPLGAHITVKVRNGHYVASSPSVPGVEYTARALLEAHLPPADLLHTANPVLRALRDDGFARPWVIPGTEVGAAVTTGAVEVGPPPYRVVDSNGNELNGLYAVGVPLESLLWGTQFQPLARTNSYFFREIDAVARDALQPGVDAL